MKKGFIRRHLPPLNLFEDDESGMFSKTIPKGSVPLQQLPCSGSEKCETAELIASSNTSNTTSSICTDKSDNAASTLNQTNEKFFTYFQNY